MRQRLTQKLMASCLMTILLLSNAVGIFGQQQTANSPAIESSPTAITGLLDKSANTAQEEFGSITSLNALIEEALERNPEIKAMARNFDAARARIPQSKALPEPMLELGNVSSLVPLPPFKGRVGDESRERMIGISQELPFPGKRSLKGRIAETEANAELLAFEQTRRNIVSEVKDVYFDLVFLTRAIETVGRTKKILEQFTKIAEARYEVGRGIQQDILKAQVEISKLIEQQTILEQRKQIAEARLNSLLYRELETPIGKPEELKPREFDFTLAGLNETAIANYPALKAQRRQIERAQYGIELAKKEFYPDFNVRFAYTNRPGMPEMYSVSVGVKLPIYIWQKQRPALEEATANDSAERRRLESMMAGLFFKIKDRYLAATTAQRLVKLYGTTIIPQASLSLESAIAGYEVGKVDFLTLLDNLVTLFNYELNYYEQMSNEEKAVAALEPLVGVYLRP